MMSILLPQEDLKLQVFAGVVSLETQQNPHVHSQLIQEGVRLEVQPQQHGEMIISVAGSRSEHLRSRSNGSIGMVQLLQVQQEPYKCRRLISSILVVKQNFKEGGVSITSASATSITTISTKSVPTTTTTSKTLASSTLIDPPKSSLRRKP